MEHLQTSPDGDRPGVFRSAVVVRLLMVLTVVATVIALDQATKAMVRAWLAPGERWPSDWTWIQISHVHNTGAAFGILQGSSPFLASAAVITIAAIAYFLFTLPDHHRWYPLALALILGGASGNLIDRVRLGHVTDFIDPWRYPAFNVADSAIVVGVIAVIILTIFEREPAHDHAPRPLAEREASS